MTCCTCTPREDPAYEAYADTCAGRQGEGTSLFCARMVGFPDPDGDLSDVPAEAPNGRQARDCWAGDMAACDIVAKPGSDPIIADIGSSCGGRQDVGLGDCVTAFAEYAATARSLTRRRVVGWGRPATAEGGR